MLGALPLALASTPGRWLQSCQRATFVRCLINLKTEASVSIAHNIPCCEFSTHDAAASSAVLGYETLSADRIQPGWAVIEAEDVATCSGGSS